MHLRLRINIGSRCYIYFAFNSVSSTTRLYYAQHNTTLVFYIMLKKAVNPEFVCCQIQRKGTGRFVGSTLSSHMVWTFRYEVEYCLRGCCGHCCASRYYTDNHSYVMTDVQLMVETIVRLVS